MRAALSIKILPRTGSILTKELNRRQLPGHFRLRMQIIALSGIGKQNKDIAVELGCGVATVRRWRKRWYKQQKKLELFENGNGNEPPATEKKLLELIKETLTDEKRIGAPCSITETEVNRLVALACEPPGKYGYPVTHWTHGLLSAQAIKMGIQVSPTHVGRLLKKRLASP